MNNIDIGNFILYMVALIFSLSLHEAAHAWMSNRFGDDLARSQGRITLNPVSHVDPVGTLLFPAIAFFTGAPLLGWARPTPVNPLRWTNRRVANIWVSAAGVIGNAIIATIAGITLRVLVELGLIGGYLGDLRPLFTDSGVGEGAVKLLEVFFRMNVVLAVFNLIPIPPLDGARILENFSDGYKRISEHLSASGASMIVFIVAFAGAGQVTGPLAARMTVSWMRMLGGA